jgi:hypothetical protein
VIISAPEASWHARIRGRLAYFPVPTMSRERNPRVATIMAVPKSTARAGSPATHESDHFQLVPVGDEGAAELRAPQDAPVPFDGDPERIELQLFEERLDRSAGGERMRLAIEPDVELTGGYFFCSFLCEAR